jgi:hypothetical protein
MGAAAGAACAAGACGGLRSFSLFRCGYRQSGRILRELQQAKDRELIEHATEIRMRAEIKAGELLREMGENGGRERKGSDRKSKSHGATLIAPRLSDLGLTKWQSSRWQKLAALSKPDQEEKIAMAKRKAEAAIEPPPC